MFLRLNISAFDMPAVFGSQTMEEGLIVFDVLDRFCSSHEQTYAEFLKSFMHLKKEDLKKQKALPPEHGTKTEDDECKLVQREWSEYSVQKEGTPSKDNQEVDNYLDFGEMDSEIVTANLSNAGCEILPGEIKEENATDYSHYEYKHTSLNFKMNLKVEECNNKTLDQVLTDEVQPFTLDEDFDYDCVRLKPKYTEAELKTISALSKQKTDSGEFNAEKLKDIADS
ncbi:intraflagellar transport-associated protein isoform X1 [Scyliorhinus canicula]|uniref:intraflagellar transport-associated protein isoform X1 n=2 Tax=Scyliorhinus canicula TaxID=7830 RepID=UPI0018F688A7|nr:intraflagellar transport-associated protein isoform X1 [Scyliorhinus canicula]